MTSKVTALAKQTLRRKRKQFRLALLRTYRSFGRHELGTSVAELGVRSGDVLFVHSSFDQFGGFIGRPTEVNATLLDVVGNKGHVLMPTIPFSGTAVEYISREPIFDVRRTPSQMGLLTELFRRQTGVLRSVHPTHSVAVAGPMAEDLISGHHLARTPCGRGTPYARLAGNGGKILFMGTDIGVMTFFHFVEEELEPELPFSPFTDKIYTIRSRDWDGNELVTETRLFNPIHSRNRKLDLLVPYLKKRGFWSECKIGSATLILLKAQEILSTCRDLARQGIYCYTRIGDGVG